MDIYCERIEPGLWMEPLNTASNLGFLLAAGVALISYRRHAAMLPDRATDLRLLIVWLVAIGLGSGLWHLTGASWALWLDVGPIQLFILTFFYSFMRRILRWRAPAIGLALAAFMALNILVVLTVGEAFNRSLGYFPAYGLLLLMTVRVSQQRLSQAPLFALATGVFLPAVTFRSLDRLICESVSSGTHFIWHLLNAVVLGSLLVAMIRLAATDGGSHGDAR